MKITGFETTILNVPESDPLADMPEERGRTRPMVALRLRTDSGIEGGTNNTGRRVCVRLKS